MPLHLGAMFVGAVIDKVVDRGIDAVVPAKPAKPRGKKK